MQTYFHTAPPQGIFPIRAIRTGSARKGSPPIVGIDFTSLVYERGLQLKYFEPTDVVLSGKAGCSPVNVLASFQGFRERAQFCRNVKGVPFSNKKVYERGTFPV